MAGQLFKLMRIYVNATPTCMSLVLERVLLFAWGNF